MQHEREFIKYIEETGYFHNYIVVSFFAVAEIYESYYQKELYLFDKDMMIDFMRSMNPRKEKHCQIIISLVSTYLKWYYNNILQEKEEPCEINIESKEIMSPYLSQPEIYSEKDLLLQTESLDFVIDKCVLMCPFYGIAGKGMEELLNLTDTNIQGSEILIEKNYTNWKTREKVLLPYLVLDWIKGGMEINSYKDEDYVEDGHLIKQHKLKNGKVEDRKKWLDNRLVQINKTLGTKYSFMQIRKYGFINACKKNMAGTSFTFKDFLSTETGKKIMQTFGYSVGSKTVLFNKYKKYFE